MGWRHHVIWLVIFGLCLPILTDQDVSSVKEDAETVCCTIPNIICSASTRERRSVQHFIEGSVIVLKSARKTAQEEIGKSREKRQTDVAEGLVEQLRVNLMDFETCVCSSNSSSNTCQMLLPPEILKPNVNSHFLTDFQEKFRVKRFACTVTSGSAMNCTLRPSAQHMNNTNAALIEGTEEKLAAQDCRACGSLYCTFNVFKTRLIRSNRTFSEEYNQCIRQREELMSGTVRRTTSLQLAVAAERTTITALGNVRSSRFPTRGLDARRFGLLEETNHVVFQTTISPQEIFPVFSQAGIWTGLGISAGMKPPRPPRRQHDHDTHQGTHHDTHPGTQYLILGGALVSGVLLGAVVMALVVYGLVRKKIITNLLVRNSRAHCSARCSTACLEQGPALGPQCATPPHEPVPIARVSPMTMRPPNALTSINTKVHSSRDPSSAVTPQTSSVWETSDYSGAYSYVADNHEHLRKLRDLTRTGLEWAVPPNVDYHLAHYEVPQTRPSGASNPVFRRAGSLPVIYHSADESLWCAGCRWGSNKMLADLPETENEYIEITPDPTPEHVGTENVGDSPCRVGRAVA